MFVIHVCAGSISEFIVCYSRSETFLTQLHVYGKLRHRKVQCGEGGKIVN